MYLYPGTYTHTLSAATAFAVRMSQTHPRRTRREVRLGKNSEVVYCEDDRIGQGQFGTVYRGRCPATDTVVAVKLLRDSPLAGSPDVMSPHHSERVAETTQDSKAGVPAAKPRVRFPSELELLWSLRGDHCPNIVQVLSVWNKPRKHHDPPSTATSTTAAEASPSPSSPRTAEARERRSNVYLLVTEFCEGGDLQHRLQALDSSVPNHIARSFTYQLCNALYTLKRRRIVHRDIKPANLLLSSRDWETATLKVADFGMAKAAPAHKSTRSKASTTSGVAASASSAAEDAAGGMIRDGDDGEAGTVPSTLFYSEMGTPMYMSPERIAGQPYDYKADVYSAGMVLLEMMRGTCVRVTRVSQLRTMVPETIQRMRLRYTTRGEAAPLWLDLVQRMTATDPMQRYAVEDVLRHAWFAETVGPALPPLTLALPPEERRGPAADLVGEGVADAQAAATLDVAGGSTTHAGPEAGADNATQPRTPSSHAAPAFAAGDHQSDTAHNMNEPPPQHLELNEAEERAAGTTTPTTLTAAATDAGAVSGGRRREPPAHWSLLGVCLDVELQHNTARCVSTGPTPKPKHGRLSPVSATSPALSLPAACGPHVITHAVRAFVDSVYLHVLQDELDPVSGLTLVSFLVELLQNGFGAYLDCLESLGGGTATVAADSYTSLSGHRFVVRDVSALPEVWQQLLRRLAHAQAAYTAQLPPRMLQNAALWRQRVLKAPAASGETAGDGFSTNEEGPTSAVDAGAQGGFGGGGLYDASTTSSEGEAAMPGLPNVASITNVSGRDGGVDVSPSSTSAALGGATPPLRVYTLTTRAEQLIFAKAVDCVQSEALALLMTTVRPLPRRETKGGYSGAKAAALQDDPFDATDCLEEEEEAATQARQQRSRSAQTPPPPPPPPLRMQSTEGWPPTGTRATLCAGPDATAALSAPHRGIALLRVLLQRAVLSAAEVGLEAEGTATARSPPLGPSAAVGPQGDGTLSTATPPRRTPVPTAEASGLAFVVQVPVYAALSSVDVQEVEKLLCTATRVFSSAQRSS